MEDNCESLGAEIQENSVNQKAGSFGIMSTHSFFFSHHINTMEGGCVSTSSHEFSLLLKVLRNHGWAREINDDEFASLGDSPIFNWFSSQINELKGNRADFEFMRSFISWCQALTCVPQKYKEPWEFSSFKSCQTLYRKGEKMLH